MNQKTKDRLTYIAFIILFLGFNAVMFYLDFFTNVFGG